MMSTDMDTLPPDPILDRRQQIRAITAKTLRRRTRSSQVFIGAISLSLVIALVPLVLVLYTIVLRGGKDLSLAFVTQLPQVPTIGAENAIGGIGNAIIGTLIVAAMSAAMAIPLSMVLGLYLVEMETRLSRIFRASVEILSGVPSILLGVFAYIFIVIPQHHFSAFAASVALALLMTPVITKAVETALRGVPDTVTEAGLALGARRSVVARRVVLPAARPGIITGTLLALARAMGETAPLLLIIGATDSATWDLNPFHSMSALPTLAYFYSSSAFPSQHAAAWGVAFVLVVLVLILNLTSRYISARLNRRVQS
jgi:phosphate transport system permease protein